MALGNGRCKIAEEFAKACEWRREEGGRSAGRYINEADVMASGRGVTSVVLRVHFRCRISGRGRRAKE